MASSSTKKPKRNDSLRDDGWQNLITGLGLANRDKRTKMSFGTPIRLGREDLDALFHGDDLTATIVGLPAQEMTRQWIRVLTDEEMVKPPSALRREVENDTAAKADDGTTAAKAIHQRLDDLEVQQKMCEAITWARLHGASLMILGADDGKDPREPLDEKNIRTFEWIHVLDRWEIQVAQRYTDTRSKKFGEPELYRIQTSVQDKIPSMRGSSTENVGRAGGKVVPMPTSNMVDVVHESRVVRFDGTLTGRRWALNNEGWPESVMTRLYPVVREFVQSFGGAAHLMTDFAQAVMKVKGLAALLASDQEGLVLKRLKLLDMARSVARLIPIDSENEDFERKQTPISGLAELLEVFETRLAAAARMPVTLLFGRSPAGMNATGESDIRLFYDHVKATQESMLRSRINRIITLVLRSKDGPTSGKEPAQWSFEFNPLWQLTEAESAALRKTQADTDILYLDRGVIDAAEVAVSRFGGDRYSPETVIDVEGRTAPAPVADPVDVLDPNAPPALDPSRPTLAPAPTPGGPTPDPAPGSGNPNDPEAVDPRTALTGVQVTAMMEVIRAVAAKELPRETGVAILTAAFPLSAEEADRVIGPVGRTFFAEKPEPPPVAAPGIPGAPKPAGSKAPPKPKDEE